MSTFCCAFSLLHALSTALARRRRRRSGLETHCSASVYKTVNTCWSTDSIYFGLLRRKYSRKRSWWKRWLGLSEWRELNNPLLQCSYSLQSDDRARGMKSAILHSGSSNEETVYSRARDMSHRLFIPSALHSSGRWSVWNEEISQALLYSASSNHDEALKWKSYFIRCSLLFSEREIGEWRSAFIMRLVEWYTIIDSFPMEK